jgi:hypothetical protein
MFLSAYLAILLGQFPVDARAGENTLTQLELKGTANGLTFDWADADESLRGQLTPYPPRAGATTTISAVLQPFSGDDFTGPITFSVRPLKEIGSTWSETVSRKPGERSWVKQVTLDEPGEYRLEVSWRTTHHKVVRGVFQVSQSGLPSWVSWAVGGGLVAIGLTLGLWVLFGRKESAST